MTTKQELTDKIQQKEIQLSNAKRESDSWNKGKYKNSSNAPISKIYVNSLQAEISDLYSQLKELESITGN